MRTRRDATNGWTEHNGFYSSGNDGSPYMSIFDLKGQRYKGFALMTGPNRFGSGYLKALLFVPIMKKVIAQDRDIMGASYANWKAFGQPQPAESPLDVFRPGIEAVIAGQASLPERRLVLDI